MYLSVAIFSTLPTDEATAPSATATADYGPLIESLASRVAQEIKNPMVAINTFAQMPIQTVAAGDRAVVESRLFARGNAQADDASSWFAIFRKRLRLM